MSRRNPIQISIPRPCHEGWDKMTPNERGRFCAHCQKTVVDFTNWSDSALYDFFEKNKANVCGHFNRSQLEREIIPPHKTPNWWYKTAISMGLTSLLAQVPRSNAQRLPTNTVTTQSKDTATVTNATKQTGIIAGQITDTANNPLNNIHITLQNDSGTSIAQTQTNNHGYYLLYDILPGNYYMYVNDIPDNNYKALKTSIFHITVGETYPLNISLFPYDSTLMEASISGGVFQTAPTHVVYVWGPFRFSKEPFFFKIAEKIRRQRAKHKH